MQVTQVRDEKEIDQFIRFSWNVYRGNPLWIPPVVSDHKKFLSGKGIFFSHCKHALFWAKEGNQIVATSAAFYDRNLVSHWKIKAGLIGFFEALPNKNEAVKALFTEAENYLKKQGAEHVWAPVNGGLANPAGLLANAYDQSPFCLMTYNPSYYHQYFRSLRYQPEKELIAFTMDLMDHRTRRKISYILHKGKESDVAVRKMDPKNFREECFKLAELYSITFAKHWGFSPASKEEIYEILEPLRLVMDYDLIQIGESEGKTIGFVLGLPNYNKIIKELDGNVGLLNVFKFLRLKKSITEGRIVAIGTVPEWRGKNVLPLLAAHAYDAMIRKGYTTCENSWILRENISSQTVARKFRSRPYKNYHIYGKKLSTA